MVDIAIGVSVGVDDAAGHETDAEVEVAALWVDSEDRGAREDTGAKDDAGAGSEGVM